MSNSFEVIVKNEWFNTDKELVSVVRQLRNLRQALVKFDSLEAYESYCKCYSEMNSLLRQVIKEETPNVVMCKEFNGICWILELDYLEDGDSPLELVSWPTINELKAEGIDTLIGQRVEVSRLDDVLDEIDLGEELADNIMSLIEG